MRRGLRPNLEWKKSDICSKVGFFANVPFNGPERDGGRADVDESEDERDQEGVLDGMSRLEERRRVVEDEVDTSPLLHHLERSSQDCAADVGRAIPERAGEAVKPRAPVAGVGDDGALIFGIGDDFSQFGLDVFRVGGLATETGEDSTSLNSKLDIEKKRTEEIPYLFDVSVLDVETRGIRQEEHADTEDQTPGKLNSDGNSVRASVGTVFGGVGDAGSQEETDRDAELVARDDGTSDLSWANF